MTKADGLCVSNADDLESNARFVGAESVAVIVVADADTRKAHVLSRCLNVLYHLER